MISLSSCFVESLLVGESSVLSLRQPKTRLSLRASSLIFTKDNVNRLEENVVRFCNTNKEANVKLLKSSLAMAAHPPVVGLSSSASAKAKLPTSSRK